MSGMLAKVMNSTVGTNNFKSLDEAIADKLCAKLKSDVRLVGSDDVLYYDQNPDNWEPIDGVPLAAYEGYITKNAVKFSYSGTVLFKTTQQTDGTENWRMIVYDDNDNELIRISLNDNDLPDLGDREFFDIIAPVSVEAGRSYSVLISSADGSVDENLSVCATPVMLLLLLHLCKEG